MNKLSFITILLTVLMSMTRAKAFAHDIEAVNNDGVTIYYKWVKNKTELVVSYRGTHYRNEYTGNVVIPESVDYNGKNYPVTSIGYKAFESCSSLSSVTIPNSVTSIAERAFSECSGLTSVTIPQSVTSIGDHAFSDCSGLTSVTIPNSVTSIGGAAFSWCSGLTSVTINCSPATIGGSPFYSCTKIKEVSFDCETVTSLFNGLSNIKNVTLSENVKAIGQSAFSGCSGLTSVTIPQSVTSIGAAAFSDCKGLTSVTIGNSVTSIGSSAFKNCSGLTSVTIPNSVTSIGSSAFSGCSGLTSVTIPNSVTSIGGAAFENCYRLTSVTIPQSVTSIGYNAFGGCHPTSVKVTVVDFSAFCNNKIINSLRNQIEKPIQLIDSEGTEITEYIVPNDVTAIGDGAFSGCTGLTSVTIGNNVTFIGENAFNGCSGLTSVTIPSSVNTIGYHAFSDCRRLTTVIIDSGELSIGRDAFYNTNLRKTIWLTNTPPSGYNYAKGTVNYVSNDQFDISNKVVYKYLSSNFVVDGIRYVPVSPSDRTCDAIDCNYDASIENINIGETVTNKEVTLTVKKVNPYTCYGNKYIKDVNLSLGGDVGDYAFYGCSGLNTATISNKGSIGANAFQSCLTLTTVTVSNQGDIGESAFQSCSALTTATITNQGDIGKNAFQSCSALTTATISNQGGIGTDAFSNCSLLETAELGQNVTSIGGSAFSGCSKLKSIIIPDAVTSLGSYAFKNCAAMTSAKTGNGIETIDDYTFSECSSLTEMIIGSKVKTINRYAFSGCSSLSAFTIPQAVTTIGNNVFENCTSLAKVIIADSEANLKLGCNYNYNSGSNPIFSSCPLDYVYIGRDISYYETLGWGYSPFYRNTSLRAVKITDSETEISENEFYGCSNLQQVEIGDGVTSIGNWAFSGCSSLKYFAFGTQVKTIGKEAFSDCTAVTKIVSKANTPPVCGSQALDDINKWECKLSVPQGLKPIYQAAEQWKEFFYIEEGTDDPVVPDTPKTDKDGVTYVADGDLAVVSTGLSAKGEVKICDTVVINGSSYQVTTISEGAFKDNSEITSVDIPNTVESIGMSAFEGCTNLGIIHIGKGVKQIASRAFANVLSSKTRTRSGEKKLEVYCYAEDVPNTAEDVFDGSPTESSILHVPAKAFKAYKDMSPWNKFKEIVALNNSTALSDKGILFSMKDDGTLEVTGLEKETKTVDILSSVTINDREYQVTSIGKRAFEGRDDIEYLSIPWSVKSIGEFAFIDCGNNMTVNIADPESWCQMELGNEHSSPLACAKKVLVFDIETDNIIIPEGVTFIGNYTFYQCRCIKSLTIPSTVTFIGSSAFEGCTGLTSLTLNEGLESVGGSAFEGCSGLQTLTIPSTVNTISINAFAGCKGITDVYCLAEDVPNTDENAFNGTPTEKSTLHVPANVVEAYRAAWPWSDFKEIVALTDVGIMKVRSDDDNGEYFDLYGRKVYQPQKGLNIFRRHDGKIVKILVK